LKILLDTHTFLWFITNDKNLSSLAREIIEDSDNDRLISIASIWEIAIKSSLGKLKLKEPFPKLIPAQLKMNLIELLHIKISHLSLVSTLPFHHRDPFDRLIIAQSLIEDLPIVSVDTQFDDYGVERIW
jgi:PIN domain nuclease of toxin-antitoxin system